ncbi:MAG: hypothetical protein KU28_10375 [Sulfurovum sp. PC08-66]|nr:MAG: hypothetical protein KU28_10375 [Sulfurovum sp. PC08-66]
MNVLNIAHQDIKRTYQNLLIKTLHYQNKQQPNGYEYRKEKMGIVALKVTHKRYCRNQCNSEYYAIKKNKFGAKFEAKAFHFKNFQLNQQKYRKASQLGR